MLNDPQGDQRFAEAKLITARFYMEHLLPRTQALLITLSAGSQRSMSLPEEDF